MTKIILSILSIFLLFTVSTQAQIKLGVKGGVNISKVYLSDDIFDDSNIIGFQVGPSLEAMFMSSIGIEASVLYSQRGLKVKENGKSTETRTNYIDIPVNLKLKIGPPGLKAYAAGGPYIGFAISGDKSINGIFHGVNDQWKAKDFQAGLNFGAGVELFKFLQAGINYQIGLTDDYSTHNYSSKDRTLSVTATVFF